PPDTGPLPGLPPLSPQQPPPGLPPVTNLAPGTGAGAVNPVPALHGLRDGGGAPVRPAQPDPGSRLAPTWTDGLRFRSADDAFHIHVGGNAQIDSTWLIAPNSAFDLPNNGGTSGIGGASATFLRRVRIRLDGDIYDQFDYMIEYDLANASND